MFFTSSWAFIVLFLLFIVRFSEHAEGYREQFLSIHVHQSSTCNPCWHFALFASLIISSSSRIPHYRHDELLSLNLSGCISETIGKGFVLYIITIFPKVSFTAGLFKPGPKEGQCISCGCHMSCVLLKNPEQPSLLPNPVFPHDINYLKSLSQLCSSLPLPQEDFVQL